MPINFWPHCWEILAIFCIPFGTGVPSGVILADSYQFPWYLTVVIYFISDVILACVCEVLMLFAIHHTKESEFAKRFVEHYKQTLTRMGFGHWLSPGWFSLVMLSFGAGSMTSRVVARSAGHGFISGWAIANTGDMMFFGLIMASTLWLNNVLGDGTIAATVATAGVLVIPAAIRKLRGLISSKR